MPRTYADMVDLVEQKLQDTSNATYTAAMINYEMEESLKESYNYSKHVIEIPVNVETRFGTASSTSSNNLVDSNKSQFLSTDATNYKEVFNATDNTWAVITSYSSASQVGLSKDIFTSGEEYYIYNQKCRNERQIYIGDMFDFGKILRADYPANWGAGWATIHNWRNVKYVSPDVIEIMIAFRPDDSNASQTSSFVEVVLEIAKPHILCQLTDLAGAVNNASGYSASATSMAIDGMGDTETIEEGDEFHIVGHRQVYVITADATTSANAATISFYPGLEAAVANDAVINFVGSTLTPDLEDIVADMTAGKLAMNYSIATANSIPKGGSSVYQKLTDWGERKYSKALAKLINSSPPITKKQYART